MRSPFYKPVKKQITLRLDADIIAWLRQSGKGYQARANVFLRSAMLRAVVGERQKDNKQARQPV